MYELLTYATIALVIGLVCGLLPVFSKFDEDQNRLKMLTGIASGIIIASAFLVVIPEGFELASTDEHGDEQALVGSVALVLLEVNDGDITPEQGIEEIEELLGGHDEHEDEHADEGHEDNHSEGLKSEIEHVIEEVESGDVNATTGISEIHELVTLHAHAEENDEHDDILIIGGAILAGFLLMLILEGSGIGHAVHEEHHHHHDDHGHDHVHHNSAGWMLVFGLTLHAAVDGLAIGAAAATGSISVSLTILLAVLIHKGPAALSLGIFSLHERESRNESIRDVIIFSLATPLMIFVAYFLLSSLETQMIGLAMLFSAGTFLYVATVDTLPDIHNAETGKKAMLHVVTGALFLTVLLVVFSMTGALSHGH